MVTVLGAIAAPVLLTGWIPGRVVVEDGRLVIEGRQVGPGRGDGREWSGAVDGDVVDVGPWVGMRALRHGRYPEVPGARAAAPRDGLELVVHHGAGETAQCDVVPGARIDHFDVRRTDVRDVHPGRAAVGQRELHEFTDR